MSRILEAGFAVLFIAGLAPPSAVAKPLHRHAAPAGAPVHTAQRRATRHGPATLLGRAPGYGGARRDAYLPTGPYGPTSADPYAPTAADNPYNPYAAPGAAIRALARRNQLAPGVTNELAPDNVATATGGPSGGVPGFSSH